MVITPTMTYASGTWTLTQKHEKMIKTAQRKMLRLIIQTKRKYKKKRRSSSNKKEEVPGGKKDENNENIYDRETEDDLQEDSNKDHDSDVSFQEADEEIDATDKEEEWIDFIKRSTEEAEEHMKNTNYHAGLRYTKRTKWRMARRIITLPQQRWNKRVIEWQPGLDPALRTKRSVGRPKRRWEDDLNEFTKTEEGHDKAQYEFKNNNSWMNEIKDYQKWKDMKNGSQRTEGCILGLKSKTFILSFLSQIITHR